MKTRLYSSAAIALVLFSGAAAAQTAPATKDGPAGSLEDIVVTARKFTENNQKAPASIAAVNGNELQQRGVTDPQALEKFLPSTSLRRQGPVTEIFIRGIGTRIDLPNYASASAFVFNGIVIQRYGTFGLTQDLDSVQSIAGPQGTLYGGSAAGGAINLFSAKPRENFSGNGALEVGNYGTVSASAAQNLSLGGGLSMRGAFTYNRRGSYFGNGINSQDNYSGRLSILYKPTSDISALVFYSLGRDTGKPIAIATANPLINPSNPWRLPATGPVGNVIDGKFTRQNNRNDIVGANIDFSIGDNAFTYIPGYVQFTADYLYFSGLAGNEFQLYDHERQHSEELRWNRRFGRLQLSAGVLYMRDLTDFNDSLLIYVSPTATITRALNRTSQTNESYAAYAQGIYSLTDTLRVTVGGRFSRDKIDATGAGANNVPINFHNSKSRGDYKVGLDYDIAPRVMVYANVQTGYIPFGYNPDISPNTLVPQSRLFSLSGGVKSRFLDNKVELNIEGFHYNYKNFQAIAFVAATGLSTVLNADKARIYGADISLRAQITRSTRLNAGIVLESAKYTKFEGVGYNYSGNRMINAPTANINAGIEQSIPVSHYGRLLARADTHYSGSYFGNFNNFPTTRQNSFTKTDLSLTFLPPSEKWSIQGFVRNVEDQPVFTTLSPGNTRLDPSVGGLEAPRTYGVRVQVNW